MSGKRIWTQLVKNFKVDTACKKKLEDMFTSNNTNARLQGRWHRIMFGTKKRPRDWKVCLSWSIAPQFKVWYVKQYYKQDGKCYYCGLSSEEVRKNYKRPNGFREGNSNGNGIRGWTLEVDRTKPKGWYSVGNCVLTCYPCNNAKSDVFTEEEFKTIGAIIGVLKGKGKTKRIKKLKKALKKL